MPRAAGILLAVLVSAIAAHAQPVFTATPGPSVLVSATPNGICSSTGQQPTIETRSTDVAVAADGTTFATVPYQFTQAGAQACPVDCVLSPYAFESVIVDWAPTNCTTTCTQTRTENWTRTELSPALNGGACDAQRAEVRTVSRSFTPDPTTFPLLQPADLLAGYQGAFRLPRVNLTLPTGQIVYDAYGFTGRGMAYREATDTLLVNGHTTLAKRWSEISIPPPKAMPLANLSTAAIVQPLTDLSAGRMPYGSYIGGGLEVGAKFFWSAYVYYNATGAEYPSLFVTDWTFATPNVQGPTVVHNTLAKVGATSAYMARIPPEWRALFGASVLVGNANQSIVSQTSVGPSVSLLDPNDLTKTATTLVGYTTQFDTLQFLRSNAVTGVAFPDGTRTVLFIGRIGTPPECYGVGTSNQALAGTRVPGTSSDIYCYDPFFSSKGPHAPPYRFGAWFYDALELLRVKRGEIKPWHVVPYATFEIYVPPGTIANTKDSTGLAWKPATRQLFIGTYGGDGSKSLIQVFALPLRLP